MPACRDPYRCGVWNRLTPQNAKRTWVLLPDNAKIAYFALCSNNYLKYLFYLLYWLRQSRQPNLTFKQMSKMPWNKSWFGAGEKAVMEFNCLSVRELWFAAFEGKIALTTLHAYFKPEAYAPISAAMKLQIDETLRNYKAKMEKHV